MPSLKVETVKIKSLRQGQTYGFRYPNLEGGTSFRRVRVEAISQTNGRVYVEGMDLDNGHESKWRADMMRQVKPVTAPVIPSRVYDCSWNGRDIQFKVFSCYPLDDSETDFRVTGKSMGQFVSMELSELSRIRETTSVLAPNQFEGRDR